MSPIYAIPGEFQRNQNESLFDFIDRMFESLFILLQLIIPSSPLKSKSFEFNLVETSGESVYEMEATPIAEIKNHRKNTIFSQDVHVTTIQDISKTTLMRTTSADTLHSTPNLAQESSNESIVKETGRSSSHTTNSIQRKSFILNLQKQKRYTLPSIDTQRIETEDNERSISAIDMATKRKSVRPPVAFQPSSSTSKASLIPLYDDAGSNKVMSIETFNKTIQDDEETIFKPDKKQTIEITDLDTLDDHKDPSRSKISTLK